MADAPRSNDLTPTGPPLALALLGYFVLVTLVITLSPFDFAARSVRLSWRVSPSDVIANMLLFVPIGFLVRSLEPDARRTVWRSVLLAAGFSVLVEIAQIFIRGRYVSLIDVATNSYGAYLGIVLRERVERWALWHPRLVGNIGLDIPLVGLLYLLLPQLWLSSVGIVDDLHRVATTLLVVCAGGFLFVAVRQHRWQTGARLTARGVERRYEIDALRRFVPVLILYLVVTALWPPFRSMTAWHGAVGFANRLNDAGVVDLLLLLEQVGGFTLLGYAAAEWRGRRELPLAADLPRVALVAASLALVLEIGQGLLVGPGASLLRALFSIGGALYGVAVYHLARAHVRALRKTATASQELVEEAA